MTGIGALLGGFGVFLGGIAAVWWVSMQQDDRKRSAKTARRAARKARGTGETAAND